MKYIKIAIIALVIIMIIILVLIFNLKDEPTVPKGEFETGDEYKVEVESQCNVVSNRNNYYVVESVVNKFFEYCNLINDAGSSYAIVDEAVEETLKEEKQENAKAIYSMLDSEYIQENGITQENLLAKLNIKSSVQIDITNMYVAEQTDTLYVYFVKGVTRNKKNSELAGFSIMVKTDIKNKTFSLFLQNYIGEHYNNINLGDTVKIQTENTIEKNDYNMYDYRDITDETYVSDLFNKFKEEIIYNPDLLYNNYLDDEYKNKKFATIETFQSYAKNNTKKHVIMKVNKYKKSKSDDSIQYVCIDQNGNYYIFKEVSVMNYTVILDTYTLDLPEFIEKYDGGTDEEKVKLNINKIIEAVNNQDYKYVYNKLNASFKNNNFSNESTFENYIKNNFYEINEITNFNYRQEGNVFICTIGLGNKEKETEGAKSVTILVRLLENRDFEISFSQQ